MNRSLEGRVAKLEIASVPDGCAVHVCDQPRSDHACAAFNQWAAADRPGVRIMHVNTGVPRAPAAT